MGCGLVARRTSHRPGCFVCMGYSTALRVDSSVHCITVGLRVSLVTRGVSRSRLTLVTTSPGLFVGVGGPGWGGAWSGGRAPFGYPGMFSMGRTRIYLTGSSVHCVCTVIWVGHVSRHGVSTGFLGRCLGPYVRPDVIGLSNWGQRMHGPRVEYRERGVPHRAVGIVYMGHSTAYRGGSSVYCSFVGLGHLMVARAGPSL